jgi:hypothetical protein
VAVDTTPEIGHSVDVLQPAQGTYVINVEGNQLGTYVLVVAPFSQDGTAQPRPTISGITGAGSSSSFQVNMTSSPGSTSQVVLTASFQSTLADIGNSLALGLIDNQGIANALSSKINAASNAAAAGDKITASNILNAFINQVNAQTGKHITGIAPQVLLADANSLLSQLQ